MAKERLGDDLPPYRHPAKRFDYIVFYSEPQPERMDCEEPQYVMKCTRCGQRVKIPVPLSLDMFVAMGKVFLKEHRVCWPNRPGSGVM